jgi:hypothetical protein
MDLVVGVELLLCRGQRDSSSTTSPHRPRMHHAFANNSCLWSLYKPKFFLLHTTVCSVRSLRSSSGPQGNRTFWLLTNPHQPDRKMLDITNIEAVFGTQKRPFSASLVSEIRSMQQKLGGKLFFHRLLEQLQIPGPHTRPLTSCILMPRAASTLYPPNGPSQLRELHSLIVSAPCQEHHKQSLLYYLAKDLSQGKDANFSEVFQKKCNLPQKYLICMQGLWCLDRMKFEVFWMAIGEPR